jgi:hypothetical protein
LTTGDDDGKHETPLQKSLFDPEFDLVVPAKSSSEVSDFSDLFSGLGGSAAGGGGGFSSLLDTSSFLTKASGKPFFDCCAST